MAIPPAWNDVWICADPNGHLQATGIDAAGRKQYLYHARWREHRDREKFDRMLRFADELPRLRRSLRRDLKGGSEPTRKRVLACAVRLLDVGLFRIGSEEYAEEDHGVGLATIRAEHVRINGASIVFDYPAKGGVRRVHTIEDQPCLELIKRLKRRRRADDDGQLLAYRERGNWSNLRSDEINEFLKRRMDGEFSAKDFRTWNATVLASVSLAANGARADAPTTKAARKRAIDRAVRAVAELLGNTPSVARRAYIDPRVFDHYHAGATIAISSLPERISESQRTRVERAVLALLADDQAPKRRPRTEAKRRA